MLSLLSFSPRQEEIVKHPLDAKIFLEGPAGCGKTTAGVYRMLSLLERDVPGNSILVLAPQRTLSAPYQEALYSPKVPSGGLVNVMTLGGLAQRMIDLFWPLVGEQAGFAWPDHPPIFLNLETAQYYMAHLVRPLLYQGYFESVTIHRNRLYSQILDNLNKAAVVGFAHTEIGQRLTSAWMGDPGQARVYQDAQECASLFRQYCLDHNMLDFSLQIEIFTRLIWPNALFRKYLRTTYRHLIHDNLEEEIPITCDILTEWLPDFDSALLIYDQQAGYRYFLGADARIAYTLKEKCHAHAFLNRSFIVSPAVNALSCQLSSILNPSAKYLSLEIQANNDVQEQADPRSALVFKMHRYFPQMLDWIAAQVAFLVREQSVPLSEIVILAPFLTDGLRFSLVNRLEGYGIPARSHRPSRALREEPVTQCLLTLTYLAHPNWPRGEPLSQFEIVYALMQAIDGLDLVRAHMLTEGVFRRVGDVPSLESFDHLKPELQERITYRLGGRYELLCSWLQEYIRGPNDELDHFLGRLFGELLSQPGFGFHANLSAGEVAANLIESVRKFRWVAHNNLVEASKSVGQEYLEMVQEGIIAAQYLRSWRDENSEAVLLAPAYTFLLSNRPVEVQFWLDVGSRGWCERLYQPLTQPYILNRHWSPGRVWTDIEENEASQSALFYLVMGLLRRSRRKIFLGLSEYNEQGFEQRSPLLRAFQHLLVQLSEEG